MPGGCWYAENGYLGLLNYIADFGKRKENRTGIDTISTFGQMIKFNLRQDGFPLITSKNVNFDHIKKELLFFLSGSSNTKELEEQGVNIWKPNTSREFLDGRGLTEYKEGDYGPAYGVQWRNWNGTFGITNLKDGIDQFSLLLKGLMDNPNGRRHIVSAWNPAQIDAMALPPCHIMYQFDITDNTLNLQIYQRSCDMFLGVPYNLASYGLLLEMVCFWLNEHQEHWIEPGELTWVGGDCHIYENHLDQVGLQTSRMNSLFKLPFVTINNNKEYPTFFDIGADDIQLQGYDHYAAIRAPMAV